MLNDSPHTGPLCNAEQWHLVFVSHVSADMYLNGDAYCSVYPAGSWRGNGEGWFAGLRASVWFELFQHWVTAAPRSCIGMCGSRAPYPPAVWCHPKVSDALGCHARVACPAVQGLRCYAQISSYLNSAPSFSWKRDLLMLLFFRIFLFSFPVLIFHVLHSRLTWQTGELSRSFVR